jgi:hypothetical protein
MIEVHHARRKALATVVTWPASNIAQPPERRGLSLLDSIEFSLAMRRVIADVVVTLV